MSRICDLEKTSGLGGDLFVGLVLGFWFFVEVLDKVGVGGFFCFYVFKMGLFFTSRFGSLNESAF
ncbi:MAG: hypothetical protein CL674_00240 [Bdellovibrionaceae bacterium]|nr:hypothetical protein [Pseudobdellovibrionaceae bacterium]